MSIGARAQAVRQDSPIEINQQVRPEVEKPKTTEKAKLRTFKGRGGPQDVKELKLPGDPRTKLDMGSLTQESVRKDELLEEKISAPYVTLSVRQAFVEDKGDLEFDLAGEVDPKHDVATWGLWSGPGSRESVDYGHVYMSVKAPTDGIYLINCTVLGMLGSSFKIEGPGGDSQITPGRAGEQTLMSRLDAADGGWYHFVVSGNKAWAFRSCTMSTPIPR